MTAGSVPAKQGRPARLAIGDVPVGDERWQERGPGIRADLGAYLGDAHEGDEPSRGHPARVPEGFVSASLRRHPIAESGAAARLEPATIREPRWASPRIRCRGWRSCSGSSTWRWWSRSSSASSWRRRSARRVPSAGRRSRALPGFSRCRSTTGEGDKGMSRSHSDATRHGRPRPVGWIIIAVVVFAGTLAAPAAAQPIDEPKTYAGDLWSRPRLTGDWAAGSETRWPRKASGSMSISCCRPRASQPGGSTPGPRSGATPSTRSTSTPARPVSGPAASCRSRRSVASARP